MLEKILTAGDIACALIDAHGMDEQSFLARCKNIIPMLQQYDVAALVVDQTRVAGRAEADGILINSGLNDVKDAIARFSPQKIVGCGNVRGRHQALEAGELNPDFIFLGALDRDIKPQAHRKNLDLAEWWAQMIEIPCAVMGGNSVSSVKEVALSGAEFVVLSRAIFDAGDEAAAQIVEANRLLDEFGPEFDDA